MNIPWYRMGKTATIARAERNHCCVHCGEEINEGETYVKCGQTNNLIVGRLHPDCYNATRNRDGRLAMYARSRGCMCFAGECECVKEAT